jgi:hypothetical protein
VRSEDHDHVSTVLLRRRLDETEVLDVQPSLDRPPPPAATQVSSTFGGPLFWLALAAFICLVSFLAMYHEMWRDEVRALSVAVHATTIPAIIAGRSFPRWI